MKTPDQNTPQTDLRKQAEEILDAAIKWEYVNVPEKDKPDFAKLRPCSPRKAALNAMLEFHQSQSTTQPETLLNTERVELIEDIEDAQEKFIQLLLPEIYGEDPDCELIYETFEDCKKFLKSLFGQPETLGKGKDIAKRFISAMTNDDEVNVFQPLSWLGTLLRLLYRPEVLNMLVSHSDNDDDAVITMLSYVDKLDKSCNELLGFCQSLSQQPYGMISEGQPDSLHPDSRQMLKTCFEELRLKMIRAQEKYGYSNGWLTQDWEHECREQLYVHAQKGDPRDVAIYALFMMYRGWSTKTEQPEDNCGFCGAKFSECGHIRMEQPEAKVDQFNVGDEIEHIKYGKGEVQRISSYGLHCVMSNGVHLVGHFDPTHHTQAPISEFKKIPQQVEAKDDDVDKWWQSLAPDQKAEIIATYSTQDEFSTDDEFMGRTREREQPEIKDGKVLTFEVFTERYSRIVQEKSILSAITKFQQESPSDKIISVNDVSYDLLNKALDRTISQQLEQSNEAKAPSKFERFFDRMRHFMDGLAKNDIPQEKKLTLLAHAHNQIDLAENEFKSIGHQSEQVDLNYESLRRNVRTISDRIGSLCALYFSPACEDHEAVLKVLKKITFEADRLDRLTKPSTH